MSNDDAIAAAAERLRLASEGGQPCAPVRDIVPAGDLAAAYAVQEVKIRRAVEEGRRIVGWKIGLTSPVVQQQLGGDQPDFGRLFADCEVPDGGVVTLGRLLQARVEAEVAFVLGEDLPARPVIGADILRTTAFVAPAIEIVDSRVAGWDITIVDTIADNASSGLYVMAPVPTSLDGLDLKTVTMTLAADGEMVATGSGAACLGHPVNAVVWLANKALEVGVPLRAGDVVLSGALGAMVPVTPGVRYEANVYGLGSVSVDFNVLVAADATTGEADLHASSLEGIARHFGAIVRVEDVGRAWGAAVAASTR